MYAPEFAGTLSVLLDDVEPATLGLLALVLRDLFEGDLSFGAKAAIGYGACRARVTHVEVSGRPLRGSLGDIWQRLREVDWDWLSSSPRDAPLPVRQAVQELIREFQESVRKLGYSARG